MEYKIRIQPEMVEIPKDDPFANDLLDRKTPIEALTNVISNIEGPCVMAVDAPWGMGKTTFIRMWKQYLRKQKFPVVSFNAWETDYFADPFAALSGELLQELENFGKNPSVDTNDNIWQEQLENLKEAVGAILKKIKPVFYVLADAADPSGLSKAAMQTIEKHREEASSGRQNTREARNDFRKTLGEAARVFTQEAQQRSLVILIDELDRCRPSYAIELLEIAKHFFSVDRIVFVIAVNFSELSHSVRAVYGEGFNARNYLERFFDIDFKLPDVDREQFVRANFQAMKIDQYLSRTKDLSAEVTLPTIADVFSAFFAKADISLRQISRVMRRLGLVLAALPSNQLFLGWASAIALMTRAIDPELYEKFIGRSIDDKEVIDSMFSRSGLAGIRNQHEGHLFEAAIITAYAELNSGNIIELADYLSPHHKTYEQQGETGLSGVEPRNEEHDRAEAIVRMVEQFKKDSYRINRIIFPRAIARIELLSAELAKEDGPHK